MLAADCDKSDMYIIKVQKTPLGTWKKNRHLKILQVNQDGILKDYKYSIGMQENRNKRMKTKRSE